LRKAVYARGGVIGVLVPSSFLMMKSAKPGNGLRADVADRADSSEGKVEFVIGVVSSSLGFVVVVAMMPEYILLCP
jgi:hypothetical protein